MNTPERIERLSEFSLSRDIRRLAIGEPPSELFRFRCDRFHYTPDDGVWPMVQPEVIALWECGYMVVGCRRTADAIEFVELDVEDPLNVEVIAHSEQGLLFWLFSHMIEDQDWHDIGLTEDRLRRAAESVGFQYFDDVYRFQRENGADGRYTELLRTRACEIP